MLIENMKKEHLPDILNVEKESFSHPWTEKMFLEELNGKFSIYRVAKEGEKAVGYMGMWVLADEGHITNVAVGKSYRGKGIGAALVEDFIRTGTQKDLAFLTLEVRVSNKAAIALYEKYGFLEVGRRKKYYENTEDAILMTKFLK